MRVLYVIDSLAGGGAETSLAGLAPHLTALGVDLEVAYLKERDGVHERLRDGGATLISLADVRGRWAWTRSISEAIAHRRPDVVHTTLYDADITGRLAAARQRVPAVSSLVNTTYGPEHFADPRLRASRLRAAQLLDILTARAVTKFHAITSHVADTMAARLRLSRDRIEVIPRGRDPQVLGRREPDRRARARTSLGIAGDSPVVLACARQEHQKGLDILVEAFSKVAQEVPGARLVIAGREGNASGRLRQVLADSPVSGSITLLGARDDVFELMCAADTFVMPSRWEGLGSILLEAMALEVPIVASDLPAVNEVVRPGREALLVPPEEPHMLATAVIEALAAPESAAARTRAARERFLAEFTVDQIAQRTAALYESVLQAPQQRRAAR